MAAELTEHQQMARDLLEAMVEIDTSAPDGSTTALTQIVRDKLIAAGFPEGDVQVFEPEPGQASLVATFRGSDPSLKPLIQLAHIDVVAVEDSEWRYPPFELTEADGFFWGRGTADDKDEASIHIANLLRLKAEGFQPRRSISVVLTSGEEGGGALNGLRWLVQNKPDLVDGWLAINEGGGGQLSPEGVPVSQTVQVAEKLIQSYKFTVTNEGGHSARPRREDNAIVHMSEALQRVGDYRFPTDLSDMTRLYMERSAPQFPADIRDAMLKLLEDPNDPAANALIEVADVRLNGTIRTTCIPTLIEGGHAGNAMPQLVEATVNCRLMPDADPKQVHELLQSLAGPKVQVTANNYAPPKPTSPITDEVFGPIQTLTAEMWPGVPVVPLMGTGSTDGSRLRERGTPVYGATGLFYGDTNNHGANENMPVKSYYDGLEFLYRLTKMYTE